MANILIVENSRRDGERVRALIAQEGLQGTVCLSGAEAQALIETKADEFEAAMILWDITGPPSGFELLSWCRQRVTSMAVVIMSGSLDATLASRAYALGARDFLEKPLDSERVKTCLQAVLAVRHPLSPLVVKMRESLIGESPALITTLKQIAQVIPHEDLSVLLIGESGTGKELLARAIHQLGSRAQHPWVAVNVGEIPSTLIESALFGHEKGAFTGATDRHVGYLEEAAGGTLFLDEIGDLDLSLQGKLLRVIQEKEFRRLNAQKALRFKARLVCATNRDLVTAVSEGMFRRDLFHRIAEVTIQIPALRERQGDVELLLRHFMGRYGKGRTVRLARESLSILKNYPFPGNIRELDNIVKSAVVGGDNDLVLPTDLPLRSMAAFLEVQPAAESKEKSNTPFVTNTSSSNLLNEVEKSLSVDWLNLPYKEAILPVERAFDRVYLRHLLERSRHNVTRAATQAGVDAKTFRKRWRESGLPSLGVGEEGSDG